MKIKKILKNKKVSNKGITLIALVITIVVLLILAGISIVTLTGENGILTQASNAKKETLNAQIEEEIKLAYNSVQIDSHVNGWNIDEKAEELQKQLQQEDSSAEVIIDGTNLDISYKQYETTINSDGIMGELAKAKIIINKFEIKGTAVETAPLPTGFYHVGGTIDEGYVISDNIADKNKGVDSAELQGNQFVWVPVEKNQKIEIDVISEEEITSVVITDPYGDDILTVNNVGTSYINTEIKPTINGPYRLVVTTNNREKRIFLNVHSLYAVDTFKDWIYTTKEEESLMNGGSLKSLFEIEDYSEKVNNNGGFYIGRYEATYESSDDGGKLASKKSTSTRETNATELKDGMIWNCITRIEALTKAKGYNTTVTSTLLTGAAWDRTIGWIFETGEKTYNELHIDSKSWGNFADDTFSNATGLINTGEYEQTKANNIYDLAGNLEEWTTQAYDENNSLHRGGFYKYEGSVTPITIRFVSGNTDVNKNICARMALFL